ncbi:MAG: DUF3783 domain-containing protein [Phascolarctobacterium sp.]|nr:DUF3783 domain-containing protein [Phascolarctobacterium sp.]
MAKLVLAYNFTGERLAALKLACMLVKSPLKVVPREQLLQPLGYLAGVPGVEPVAEEYAGSEAAEEMLILCGFNRPDLDRLLSAIRKGKLKQVALKAALTPTNALWSGVKLQGELAQEHAYMHGKQAPKPKHK